MSPPDNMSAGNSSQSDLKPLEVSLGVLRLPRLQNAQELETLAYWGALPQIISIPDAASLLALVCKQNPVALRKIITQAIRASEIRYWALSHSGGWVEGMVREFYCSVGKPRLRPATKTQSGKFTMAVEGKARLHIEAMGINPIDAIGILRKRGRGGQASSDCSAEQNGHL